MFTLKKLIFVYILLPLVSLSFAITEQSPHCTSIIDDVLESCVRKTSAKINYEKIPATIIDNSLQRNDSHANCSNYAICSKSFRIARFRYQTYSDIIHHVVANLVDRCCGNCANLTVTKHFTAMSEIKESRGPYSDFIYPIFSRASFDELYDYNFIPIFAVQGAYYFSLRNTQAEMGKKLIFACLDMWPLLIICILLAFISGFVIWVLEMGVTTGDFASSFRSGLFEGFWWSIVSMTTVGYGDKSPKSLQGRLFAVIWILLGITICSIFTGTLTTEIMNARSVTDSHILGNNIGILRHRLEDITMVIQHGGMVHEVRYNTTMQGIIELIEKVESKVINGFLLNKDTYQYFVGNMKRPEYKKIGETVQKRIVKTEKLFRGEGLSFGMLVRNMEDYKYFENYFHNNRLFIEACYAAESSKVNMEHEADDGSSDSQLFYTFLYYSIGILAVIGIIGLLYELRAHYKANSAIEQR